MATSRTPSPGAHPVGPEKKRPWWLLLLPLLIVAIVLALLLSQCGGDDEESTSSTKGATSPASTPSPASATPSSVGESGASTSPASPSAAPSSPPATPDGSAPGTADGIGSAGAQGGGTLTAGGTDLLPVASAGRGGDLSSLDGEGVEARAVEVLSVPADEGFWVGASDTDRVWVELAVDQESPFQVQAGDLVDFSGTMTTHGPDYAAEVGVDQAEGATLLTREAAHITVETGAVSLTQG